MPHGDEVESAAAEILLVEEAATKLDPFEGRESRQILEVHPDGTHAVQCLELQQESPGAAPSIQHLGSGSKSDVPGDDFGLCTVETVHRAPVQRRHPAPVGLLAVRDVLVVVPGLDVLQAQARALIDEPAPAAALEGKTSRPARQIVLASDEMSRGIASAEVARDVFELPCSGFKEAHRIAPYARMPAIAIASATARVRAARIPRSAGSSSTSKRHKARYRTTATGTACSSTGSVAATNTNTGYLVRTECARTRRRSGVVLSVL